MSGIQMALMGSRSSSSPALATYTLTTGNIGTAGNRYRGFDDGSFATGVIGSISPTTFTLNGGTTFKTLLYDEAALQYVLRNLGGTNSGWTTMYVDATAFTRTAMTYTFTGGVSSWVINTSDTISTQVFGAASTNHTITFY